MLIYSLAVGGFIPIRYNNCKFSSNLSTNSIFTKLSGYLDIDIMLLLKANLLIIMLKLLRENTRQFP